MRRRLLASTLGAVALAIVLLGLPLAVAVRGVLTSQALAALQREAEQVQVVLNESRLTPLQQAALLQSFASETGSRFVLLDRGAGRAVRIDTGAPPAVPPTADHDVRRALHGEVGEMHAEGVLAVAVPVRLSGVVQVLRAVRDDAPLRTEVRQALWSIAGLAAASMLLAAAAALWQARRLATPLEHLAEVARRLGDGDFSARAARSGMPETDEVGRALDLTAERLRAMVERSRSFGADASHQLRTPLTALRLDLEALEASGAGGPLLDAAVAEADRLEATIAELLSLADPPHGADELDVAAVVVGRVEGWAPVAAAAGRRVVLRAADVPPVRARSAAVGQSLQVLLDNALEHGTGTISVVVDAGGSEGSAAGSRSWVRVCVSDEGPGFAPGAVEGRGLGLARSLLAAEGGRIAREGGSTVCLLLPAAAVVPALPLGDPPT